MLSKKKNAFESFEKLIRKRESIKEFTYVQFRRSHLSTFSD